MGMWWFGRKSAPDTVRPYVPDWLTSGLYGADAEEGFARSYEGLCVLVKSSGLRAEFRGGAWEYGVVRAGSVMIGGLEVLSTRSAAIPSPSGGATVDSEARIALGAVLAALRHHGLIES
ncbi:MAG: hypothetical protein ACREXY_26585 [Gammaproteobacteria bacterium]